MDTQTILFAFGLTLFAGLSTVLGSVFAFFTKTTNTKFLSASLGFSAGVMLYVSFVELLDEARESLSEHLGEGMGSVYTVIAFFGGIAVIAIIDKLIPSFENPHEMHKIEEIQDAMKQPLSERQKRGLHRTGVFTALAIAIHNFPEGLVTFTAALVDPALGVSIAIAIAIHNIPEGIAVAVPIYYATGSRKKAFLFSLISGLAEPVGALMGFFIFLHFFNDLILGVLFAAVAGIMVFISLDELLPAAERYGEHHLSIYGLILGMAVMAGSLLVLG